MPFASTTCIAQLTTKSLNSSEFEQFLLRSNHITYVRSEKSSHYEVLMPTATGGLTIAKANSFDEAFGIAELIPKDQLINWEELLSTIEYFYRRTVESFREFAHTNNLTLEHRLKSKESLKEKAFDRTRQALLSNSHFSLENLSDIIGIRIIFPHFLDFKKYYHFPVHLVKMLGFKATDDIDIKLKGEYVTGNEVYYKAIHFRVNEKIFKYEIQVMSRMMKVWHKWDHDRVYKSSATGKDLERVKELSRVLSKAIHDIEYCTFSFDSFEEFKRYIHHQVDIKKIDKKNRFKPNIDVAYFEILLKENRKLCQERR